MSRLTAEREKEIRGYDDGRNPAPWRTAQELLAEIGALRAERDEFRTGAEEKRVQYLACADELQMSRKGNKRLLAALDEAEKTLELIADKHGDWTESFMRTTARKALKTIEKARE